MHRPPLRPKAVLCKANESENEIGYSLCDKDCTQKCNPANRQTNNNKKHSLFGRGDRLGIYLLPQVLAPQGDIFTLLVYLNSPKPEDAWFIVIEKENSSTFSTKICCHCHNVSHNCLLTICFSSCYSCLRMDPFNLIFFVCLFVGWFFFLLMLFPVMLKGFQCSESQGPAGGHLWAPQKLCVVLQTVVLKSVYVLMFSFPVIETMNKTGSHIELYAQMLGKWWLPMKIFFQHEASTGL